MKHFGCYLFLSFCLVSTVFGDINVPSLPDNWETIRNATIQTIQGDLSQNKKLDNYPFQAPRSGRYRFEMRELRSNSQVYIALLNRANEKVTSNYVGNGGGLTLNLNGGETYTIRIEQQSGLSPYHLIIGHQKESVNISALNRLVDSLEYIDQINRYSFTAPHSGQYRFEMAELRSNSQVYIDIINRLDEKVTSNYVGNGGGLTLNLNGGETYIIRIQQHSGLSPYHLIIGHQKETVRIGIERIYDSTQYTDQLNRYSFTVPNNGQYRFELTGLRSNSQVYIDIINRLDEKVTSNYVGNGGGLTLNLNGGETYIIRIQQQSGLSPYTLTVMRQ